MDRDAVRLCRAHADFYRAKGMQPLPSDPTPGGRKKPLCRYADYWERLAPPDLFDRFPTTNIQVMLGRYWGLCVLDFDGKAALKHRSEHWPRLPRTWVVESGGGGEHWWFATPKRMAERRRRFLWKGDGTHEGIEFLCDGSLAMAPPSIHPKTDRPYRWRDGWCPRTLARPAMVPAFVLAMPAVDEKPKAAPVARPAFRRLAHAGMRPDGRYEIADVMAAIPDLSAVARDVWGLRFAGGPESNGWVSVHDFNREDKTPSARFHLGTGLFWRPGERVVPFFQLGVEMGHYGDFREALADIAARFHVPPNQSTPTRLAPA